MCPTLDTYSDDDGDLCADTLASVPLAVHLCGGDLHDEGPVHRQLTLPVYDGLGVERPCALVDPEDMLRSPRDAVLYVGVDLSVPVHCLHLQHLHIQR